MKYKAYWTAPDGKQNDEGIFNAVVMVGNEAEIVGYRLTRETKGDAAQFPDLTEIVLPAEGKPVTDKLVKNPQYWGRYIQVHLGDFAFGFIFEVIGTTFTIAIDDEEKKMWLEDFLADNDIPYSTC